MVAALAVVAVGVVLVRVVSGLGGETPAPQIQVVDGSPGSGHGAGTPAVVTPTSGDPGSGTPGVQAPTGGGAGSSGAVSVGSSGTETGDPAGLPGDSGDLPGG